MATSKKVRDEDNMLNIGNLIESDLDGQVLLIEKIENNYIHGTIVYNNTRLIGQQRKWAINTKYRLFKGQIILEQ